MISSKEFDITDDQQKDIFLAILSMNAYNKGNNSDQDGQRLQVNDVSANIGNATAMPISDNAFNNLDSFVGTSYDVSGQLGFQPGQAVVTYRGTDDKNVLSNSSDFWNGWTLGAGFPATSEATDALNYYINLDAALEVEADAKWIKPHLNDLVPNEICQFGVCGKRVHSASLDEACTRVAHGKGLIWVQTV